ncbi:uncharacterized protein CANTADRAFT_8278 [Suhomyces tanzawaensis NRRL Y-17324]|uniref:Sorting nexin-4 n=1 Tax=Suhomyces tanzawaensis NRRL Y-17324 TaxID=984487 RepID=A0A1E4SCC7_9ASCO|nr:uncharacterized protein CANTADRAFT_8278 [Suhomyces tanzawaensis NRRL Y-17324]ODV77128.1 hypothetical protein CANTADRAFT_8278 [Suhomyces tanzawaensis NRRL Y-17324]
MSSEDQFTSIQWDRGEIDHPPASPSVSGAHSLIPEEIEDTHKLHQEEQPHEDPVEEAPKEQLTNPVEPPHQEEAAPTSPELEAPIPHPETRPSPEPATTTDNHTEDADQTETTIVSSPAPSVSDKGATSDNNKDTGAADEAIAAQFEKYSIAATVTTPIRDVDASSKPFISYLLATTTDHPAVLKLSTLKKDPSATIKVRRRYGDFRILHDCLTNDYPTLLIPPMPSKLSFKYLTGDTFSTEFVHKRLHSLDRFVKFILQHKYLSQLSIFHLFISDANDWTTFTKNLKINYKDEDANGGFVNKVVNEDLITETVMNFLTPSKHKRETNKDILEINDKLKRLYENLVKLDKIFVKLNKKNHDLSIDYEQFLAQIMKLSILQLVDQNQSEPSTPSKRTSVGENDSILNNFKIFSSSLDYFLKNWSELHHYIDESFLVALKDCAKYIASLTNLIELQHNKKIDLQVLQDYLNKARSELANLGGGGSHQHHPPPTPVMNHNSGGLVNNTTQLIKDTLSTSATAHIGSTVSDQKVQKLQQKTIQLENEIEAQTKLVNDLTHKIITEEYPNWDRFNRNELKASMLGLCDQEIKFYRGLVDNWSDVELKLVQRLDELK